MPAPNYFCGVNKRIVVGLSGGVDSSVAAHLLLEQGYEVIGIFMRNWHDDSVTINNECPWIDDSNDAMLAASHLGIPFHVLDMSKEYHERIVEYMFREYAAGRTPNPDILCNREIKFDLFLEAARQLRIDTVATGHYCRREPLDLPGGERKYRLLAGVDANKDQSYFLCQVSQEQLGSALFPIGHLKKNEVREIARKIGLPNAEKKDSQGLCFVGKVKLPVFLKKQLLPNAGKVIEIPRDVTGRSIGGQWPSEVEREAASLVLTEADGKVAGEHDGIQFYTIGQRKGLSIGGRPEPMFILDIDPEKNLLFVGQGEHHPALYRKGLFIPSSDLHWVRDDLEMHPGETRNYRARIRYRQPLADVELHRKDAGMYLIFKEPQRGIARGQFAAWYDGEELIGSGVIA